MRLVKNRSLTLGLALAVGLSFVLPAAAADESAQSASGAKSEKTKPAAKASTAKPATTASAKKPEKKKASATACFPGPLAPPSTLEDVYSSPGTTNVSKAAVDDKNVEWLDHKDKKDKK